MGNLAFQDVDLLLSDIQRSAPNREFLGLQSVQELAKAVQFIGWVGVVHKPMIGRWPLFDQTATRARSRSLDHLVGAGEQLEFSMAVRSADRLPSLSCFCPRFI
jgi:hypothetical protein